MTIAREARLQKFIKQVEKHLIVSCQALPDEALFGSDIMAKMAIWPLVVVPGQYAPTPRWM